MGVSCDLEVDVNGNEIFFVDKKIISSYSGRISKLFGKSRGETKNQKIIFHDFPGGAGSFELMARFCYNNGKIEINPLNLPLLYCTAHFMEMNTSAAGSPNLLQQTEKSLEEIRYWTWPELLAALKQCQNLLDVDNSSIILEKCLDSLLGKLELASEASPCPSSSSLDSSALRLSSDTRSTESLKNGSFRATWWFEDLVAINPNLVETIARSMVSRKFDHSIISKFLLFYQKSRFVPANSDEKRRITEMMINMLYSLDQSSIPFKSLLGILRIALNLNISKSCRSKLECMIGSQMDQTTLDNLLVPSPSGTSNLYDVNLVLRFLKCFLGKRTCHMPLVRLKKVASLMDLYIAEVAPDPSLKPSKFMALVRALPDSARDSHDAIYHAMDMFLEVHGGLSKEEKLNICCGLNYEKLSAEARNHLAQNKKFPSKSTVEALISQQSKLKSLLQETNLAKPFIDSPGGDEDGACKQIVLYSKKIDLSAENQKLRAHLQGMQWRVLELEKVCRKMQNQMNKIMKSRLSRHSNARSLPRLCS
ncbi:hypothetical protein NMG60_11003070 [Bertholletia excelsa]